MNALAFCLLSSVVATGTFEDGTLIFVEDSNELVEFYTDSKTTHVAIIVKDHVYQAEPPTVRKLLATDYLKEIAQANDKHAKMAVSLYTPKVPLTEDEVKKMVEYLDKQVGRRYSIRGFFRKDESDGIHCSQICTEALVAAGRVKSERPWKVSPTTLRDSLASTYNAGKGYYLVEKKDQTRWQRFCAWCTGAGRWCGWSCEETWTFCR